MGSKHSSARAQLVYPGYAMGWYDMFSGFYDRSLEPLYREQRGLAANALALAPGHTVLDLPCGTGQSFDEIAPRITNTGTLIGVDFSAGMLAQASKRAGLRGWDHVHLLEHDVRTLDPSALATAVSAPNQAPPRIDRLHVFLGLTAFPDWEQAFERLWGLLAPGGRCVVVDVYADKPDFQGRMVNLVARADIRRRTWTPLERLATNYARDPLPSTKQHGGQLYLARGDKPESPDPQLAANSSS
ncbi:ubiquinone/menaquinone biosynthesis methyltransferase [Enhygromyxa salina]|uniref:Ubiquinone/menaquinone biosynthesis methyltransferase n=1 Tax=Enhygromyxa salina TaxID=215803 RepID=A0A0C2D316_9BACT|nr:class I SAM-dependent methyltransferase [Enhygromyxa salina]KIG17636.1 ubiquinone/menaquinone biosynthesis methyltransferase [Enhygromyxa salina]